MDGFTTLETGNEAIINPETSSPDYPAERRIFDRDRNDISLPNDKNPWKEVIHFDVKSGNSEPLDVWHLSLVNINYF